MVSIYIRRFQCREDLLPILMTAGLLAFLPPGWIEIPDDENTFAALTQVKGSGISALLQQVGFVAQGGEGEIGFQVCLFQNPSREMFADMKVRPFRPTFQDETDLHQDGFRFSLPIV